MNNCPCCGHELPSNKFDKDLIIHPDLLTFSFNGFIDMEVTRQEYRCLKELYENIGEPVTRDNLTQICTGIEYDGFNRTIDMLIVRLRKSLQRTKYTIKTVRTVGYMLVKNTLNQSAA